MASSAEEGRSPSPSSPWRLSRSQSLRRLSRSPSPARGHSALSSSPPSRPRSRSWSPRSPPPPPPPPQAKAEKRSFYMFFDHGAGAIGLSLCTVEVEIPSVYSPSFPLRPIPIPIVPTLLFRATDFPTPMRCVHLGSKFYFLGGEISIGSYNELKSFSRDQLYPPNVYIFDPTTPKARANANANAEAKDAKDFVTPGTPMKTGKPSPLLLFVAFGKIYALSSPEAARAFHNDLEYFEVFDPITNQWTSLPRPPCKYFRLHTHAVVKGKVYIMAATESKLYCFDLNKEEWEPSIPLLSSQLNFPRIFFSDLIADIAEDSLYGFGFLYSSLVALGPVKDTELADGECFNNLIHILPVDILPPWNGLGKLLHLGNRRICYVESVNPVVLPVPMDFFDTKFDAQTLYISLTIFEALSDTFAHQDRSEAKLLLPAIFVAKIPWDTHPAHLCNCSLIPVGSYNVDAKCQLDLAVELVHVLNLEVEVRFLDQPLSWRSPFIVCLSPTPHPPNGQFLGYTFS